MGFRVAVMVVGGNMVMGGSRPGRVPRVACITWCFLSGCLAAQIRCQAGCSQQAAGLVLLDITCSPRVSPVLALPTCPPAGVCGPV